MDIPNTVYKDYVGEYGLTAEWKSTQDSMVVFSPYTIRYKSTGVDTFASFAIRTNSNNIPDTVLFHKTITDSTITVYFQAPFSGTIKVIGIRPNTQEVEVALLATVRNPFKLQGNTTAAVGQAVTLIVAGTLSKPLRAKWFVNNNFVVEGAASNAFTNRSDTAVARTVYALITDTLGHSISTDTATITIAARQPILHFTQDSLDAPVGQEIAIPVAATDCDSIKWTVKSLGLQTTTTGSLKVTFTSVGRDTIIATGKSKYGLLSTPDTLYIKMSVFNYALQIDTATFPATIRTRHWAAWSIAVTQSSVPVTGISVHYEWVLPSGLVADSLRYSADSSRLDLYFNDSVAAFLLKVRARVGNDSTYWQQQQVLVRAYKPTCSFTQNEYSVPTNTGLTVSVAAHDSGSGTIVGIYYFTSENSTIVSTNNQQSLTVKFTTPGQKTITAWAVDNDGYRDSATASILVTTNSPWFLRSTVDTTVWIKDSITLHARAQSGSASDSIIGYLWDCNNDNVYERNTTVDSLRVMFPSTGTYPVRVQCRNTRNDSAGSAMVFSIVAAAGAPQVTTLSCTPAVIYIGGQAAIRIVARDTNGTVKRVAIRRNSGQDTIFNVRPFKNIDTTVYLSFPVAGKYRIEAAVYDDDSVKSVYATTTDSLIVNLGEPVVQRVRPDTAWYNTQTTFTVSASDNGSITGYAVSYNNSTWSSYSPDSTFQHAFTDTGKQYVYIKAKDNDNNISAVLKDSVVVKAGHPVITGVTLTKATDSIFVLDQQGFIINAADSNKTVRVLYISYNNDAIADDSSHVFGSSVVRDTLYRTFTISDTGLKSIRVWAIDDDGLLSATAFVPVTVRLGKPVAIPVFTDSVWINDTTSFKLRGIDTNGITAVFGIQWSLSGAFEIRTDSLFSHSFSDTGFYTFRAFVKDDDSISSDTVTRTVYVKRGMPRVSAITTDSGMTNIYVKDVVTYRIKARDSNDRVDTVYVSWNNDTVFEQRTYTTTDSAAFTHVFARADSGLQTIVVRVKDNDGFVKDTAVVLTIKPGVPVISNLVIDTTGNNLFVRDNRRYSLRATDANGLVKVVYAAWNGGTTANDSLLLTNSRALVDTFFYHAYDTTGGNKTARFWCRDEDTVVASYKDTSISLRKAAPLIWADKNGVVSAGDTLWIVASSGAGNYYVHARSYDTNGVNNLPAKWYWNASAGLSGADSTVVDSFRYNFAAPLLNTGFPFYIYARDDDGLLRGNITGNKFIVFADEPPPTTTTTTTSQPGMPNVRLAWYGLDTKDDSLTQFAVVIGATAGTITDTVVNFTAANNSAIGKVGSYLTYTFNPQSRGINTDFNFKVIARDARGSKPAIINTSNVMYPY